MLMVAAALVLVGCGQVQRAARPADPPKRVATPVLADSATRFPGRLLGLLATGGANVAVSPFSISQALALAHVGARGATAAQIAAVLGLGHGPPESPQSVRVANGLYGQRGVPFRAAFLNTLAREYGAPLHLVDFMRDPAGAVAEINAWVDTETHGKIPQLLSPGDVDTSTRLTLIDAIYLHAKWLSPFDPSMTAPAPFQTPSGEVDVPTMRQSGEFGYLRGDGYRVLELPYRDGSLAFDVLLPDGDGVAPLLERVTRSGPLALLHGLQMTRVAVALPRLRLRTSLDLTGALEQLGMPRAFCASGGADFSGMAPIPLCIRHVVHAAYVRVDEAGTEAAAATGAVMVTAAIAAPPPIQFDVDRPFVFVLRDTRTSAVLFEGVVRRPEP